MIPPCAVLRYRSRMHQRIVIDTVGKAAEYHRHRVSCRRCRRCTELDLVALAQQLGADYPLDRLSRRLRCSGCGSRQVDHTIAARATYCPFEAKG